MERKVEKILERKLTYEGAGEKLRRVLGNDSNSTLDPFLLLDHFGSTNPRARNTKANSNEPHAPTAETKHQQPTPSKP